MKVFLKALLTVVIYLSLLFLLYRGIAKNYEHEELESYSSLICYSCIGV